MHELQSYEGVNNLIIFLLFVILLLLGVPIAFALLVPSIAVCAFYPEIPIQLMSARLANSYFSSSLLAIPLFILAAQILNDIKVTDIIFGFVNKLVGHIRGGLGHVNVVASVVFAGMSGSAVADASGLGQVEIKAMNAQGYPPAFSAAITAASATIGPIVPPSIPAIIYGSIAGVSVGKLLIGGFFPGLIMAICLMVGISILAKHRGLPKTKFAGLREIWESGYKAVPGLVAPFILIGGMLFGWFTPTEAATVAVVYSIIIGFILKTLTFKGLWQALRQAALDTTAMMFIFLGATLIGLLVTRIHMADAFISFISTVTSNPATVLMLLNIFLLIAGCLLDPTCCLFLLTPILVPLVKSFGIDEVHFGIVMILNLMIGLITPPMGGLMFITCKIAEIKLTDFLKECWLFMVLLVIALLIVTYVPQTVLWLPSLFMK
jgi:tripartite ATP-independent transporter DctM subunit